MAALTLDMSNAGRATFNENVTVGGNLAVDGADFTITANVNTEIQIHLDLMMQIHLDIAVVLKH